MVSRSAERGLANWPAMRPIFTTGTPPPNIATTAICSMTLKESLILLALNCEKLSAQSPPAEEVALLLGVKMMPQKRSVPHKPLSTQNCNAAGMHYMRDLWRAKCI